MAETLTKDVQSDFSAGGFPLTARDEIPPNGFEDGINCLIGDDGLPYGRGGTGYKGGDPAAVIPLDPYPGRWLFDGYLAAGPRTATMVWGNAGSNRLMALDPADDSTPVIVTGTPIGDLILGRKATFFRNVVVLPGGYYWAGYVPGAGAGSVVSGVGSVTLTQGSSTVVGVGTAWVAGTKPAGLFLEGPDTLRRPIVKSVTDATHLELVEPWDGATVTKAAGTWFTTPITVQNQPPPAGFAAPVPWVQAAVGTRLFVSQGGAPSPAGQSIPQNRIYQSDRNNPWRFVSTNYWDLPDGTQVKGMEALRDTAIVFSTRGVYGIFNTALNLTDAAGNVQQRLELLDGDLMLWSWAGVTEAGGRLVVPAVDDIYLFDPSSGRERISGGFHDLYRSYVEAGYGCGHAIVYHDHYLMPIVASSGQVIDLLKCRLKPTRRGRGVSFAWTRDSGFGGQIASFAARAAASGPAQLFGVENSGARILTIGHFTPATVPLDADGSVPVAVLTTREFGIGNGVKNFLARIRVRYDLAGSGAPTISAAAGVDGAATAALTLPSATAPAATIAAPKTWMVRKRGRGVRFVLTVTGSTTKAILHSIEAFIRPSGRS